MRGPHLPPIPAGRGVRWGVAESEMWRKPRCVVAHAAASFAARLSSFAVAFRVKRPGSDSLIS
eukprot:10376154-Alexandrium_andersonii.AAC.1